MLSSSLLVGSNVTIVDNLVINPFRQHNLRSQFVSIYALNMCMNIRRTPLRDLKGYQDTRLVHAIHLDCCSSTEIGLIQNEEKYLLSN